METFNKYIKIIVVTIFIVFLVKWYINPSSTEINRAYKVIYEDVDKLLNNGEYVIYRSQYVKATARTTGGMPITYEVYISQFNWTEKLDTKYKMTLKSLGWQAMNEEQTEFCKQGILATLDRESSYEGGPAGLISMEVLKRGRGKCWDGDTPIEEVK